MKFAKKIVSVIVTLLMCVSSFTMYTHQAGDILNFFAYADESEDTEHGLGVPPVSELDLEEYYAYYADFEDEPRAVDSSQLNSSCDLSMQNNFPLIGNQGGLWAHVHHGLQPIINLHMRLTKELTLT